MKSDVDSIPSDLNAPWLKRFFRAKFGIPVRVKTSSGKARYIEVWISSNKRSGIVLTYDFSFSPELGNRCMRVIYPGSEKLREQSFGGNVRSHSIAMLPRQWREVLSQYIENPVTVEGD